MFGVRPFGVLARGPRPGAHVPQCYDPAMRGRDLRPRSGFDQELTIDVAPSRAMGAFFDPDALSHWWQAIRSVTTPRVLGVYALDWAPSADADSTVRRRRVVAPS